MRIPLVKKVIVSIFNLIFPPFAVGALTGFTSRDTLLNCCLFCLAVFPAHVHGGMISWTYFRRKRKVRKNRFPGEERAYIFSEKIQTGGAGWEEYDHLRKVERNRTSKQKSKRRTGSRVSSYGYDGHYPKDMDIQDMRVYAQQTTSHSQAMRGDQPVPSRSQQPARRTSYAY